MIPANTEQHLYGELRRAMTHVRWLKRACLLLLVANLLAGIALWLVRNPQSLGL